MKFSREQLVILTLILVSLSIFNFIVVMITGGIAESTISFYLNSAPYLNVTIPNQTWQQDKQLIGIDLDDHFVDREGDPLNYTSYGTMFVNVIINDVTHVITFTPIGGWCGLDFVYFNATDPYGATGTSNLVQLNVTCKPPEIPAEEIPPSAGGPEVKCTEQWVCKDWSPCFLGIQTRTCRDLAYCGSNYSKPATLQTCHVPSCSDRIQNQNETGIDCGGPCLPCLTCFDNIKNCHDGYCEEDVDCGGPCLPCALVSLKKVEFLRAPWLTLCIVLIVVFSIEAYLYARKQKLREQILPLSQKRMKEAAKKLLNYMSIDRRDKEKK